jgi:large subunit ribosomal protein L35
MKLKSSSTAKKRVRVTGTGKLKVYKSAKQHLLINKSGKAKRANRNTSGKILSETKERQMRKLLPYA